MTQKEFNGGCPICSARMFRVDNSGIVKCPKDHYSIFEKTFDRIWNEYAPIITTDGVMSTIISNQLLERLRNENLINRTIQNN